MFRKDFVQGYIEMCSGQFLTQRRNKASELSSKYPEEFALAISMSSHIRYSRISPKYNTLLEVSDGVIDNLVYAVLQNSTTIVKQLFYSLPIPFQNFMNLLFTDAVRYKVGEHITLQLAKTFYSKNELLLHFNFPDVLEYSSSLVLQGLTKNEITPTVFPMYFLKFPKVAKRIGLYYLIRDNGRVVSNCNSSVLRDTILINLIEANTGVLFYGMKDSKYKNKYLLKPILTTSPSNLKQFLKLGLLPTADVYFNPSYNSTDKVEVLKSQVLCLNSETELLKVLQQTANGTKQILYNFQGLAEVKLQEDIKNVNIIDWLYDEEFNPIGAMTTVGAIRFRVTDRMLETGFLSKRVSLLERKFKGEVVDTSFMCVKDRWHGKFTECCVCGTVESSHKQDGVCNKCFKSFVEVLRWEHCEKSLGSCANDFNTIIENFEVIGSNGEVSNKLVKGVVYNLPLY